MDTTLLKKRALLAAVVGALLTLAVVWAGEPWESKAASEWTQEEALKVLTDSPWGKQVTFLQQTGRLLAVFQDGLRERKAVYREGPNLPRRVFEERPDRIEPELVQAEYGVRWSSAAVVQQALARLKETSSVLAEAQAPPPELSPEHYIITARVVKPPAQSGIESLDRLWMTDEEGRPYRDRPPQVSDLFAGFSPEQLGERAELRTSNKTRWKPERVLRHGIGLGEGISFYFPRQQAGEPALPPGTKWVEFVFRGPMGNELKVKFELRKMQVNSQPDY